MSDMKDDCGAPESKELLSWEKHLKHDLTQRSNRRKLAVLDENRFHTADKQTKFCTASLPKSSSLSISKIPSEVASDSNDHHKAGHMSLRRSDSTRFPLSSPSTASNGTASLSESQSQSQSSTTDAERLGDIVSSNDFEERHSLGQWQWGHQEESFKQQVTSLSQDSRCEDTDSRHRIRSKDHSSQAMAHHPESAGRVPSSIPRPPTAAPAVAGLD